VGDGQFRGSGYGGWPPERRRSRHRPGYGRPSLRHRPGHGDRTAASRRGITGLSIIPTHSRLRSPGQTGQFIALGNHSSGLQQNLTNLGYLDLKNTSVGERSVPRPCHSRGVRHHNGSLPSATNLDKTVVTATGTFTVTGLTSEPLISLAITPSTLHGCHSGSDRPVIAIGTFAATSSTPGTRDLTTTVLGLQPIRRLPLSPRTAAGHGNRPGPPLIRPLRRIRQDASDGRRRPLR